MIGFVTVLFVLQLGLAKGEPTLQIFKTINGADVPFSYKIREVAGTNFTLTCKLSPGNDGDTTDYMDDTISWGWKRKDFDFFNAGDLKKLAEDNSNLLRQFINKNSKGNQATIPFEPLLLIDSGKYFCMSLKYKLFNITKIHVIQNSKYDHPNYDNIKEEKNLQRYSKSSLLCTDDMFMCNSRKFCISNKHLCDKFEDCIDGSDENKYLCNTDPCKDGVSCSINHQEGNLDSYFPISDDIFKQFMTVPNVSEIYYPKFGIPTMPSYIKELQEEQYSELEKLNTNSHHNVDSDPRETLKLMGFALLPIPIIIIVVRVCLHVFRNKPRPQVLLWRVSTLTVRVPNNSFNNNSSTEDLENNQRSENEDLPPTYDEAVVNVPQNTSLLK